VGFGDRLDDCQAEAASVGGRFLRPAEALEGMVKEVGRKPLAFVEDVQLRRSVALLCPEADAAGTVSERVVDNVKTRILEACLSSVRIR
jgi:hypothetical protein